MRVRGVQAPAEGDALPIAPHEAASQRGEGGRCAAREARPTFVLVSPERKLEARLGVPSVGGGQQPLARRRRVPLQPVRPLADRHACNDIGPHCDGPSGQAGRDRCRGMPCTSSRGVRGGCARACLRACGLRKGSKGHRLCRCDTACRARRRSPRALAAPTATPNRPRTARALGARPTTAASRSRGVAGGVLYTRTSRAQSAARSVWGTFKNHSIAPSKDPLRSLTTPMKYCAPTQHGHRGRHSGAALPKQCPTVHRMACMPIAGVTRHCWAIKQVDLWALCGTVRHHGLRYLHGRAQLRC